MNIAVVSAQVFAVYFLLCRHLFVVFVVVVALVMNVSSTTVSIPFYDE